MGPGTGTCLLQAISARKRIPIPHIKSTAKCVVSLEQACLIDKLMLQFIHNEEINPLATSNSRRLIKSDNIFGNKELGGQGLKHAFYTWSQLNRALMIRCFKALVTPALNDYGQPSLQLWIAPGYELIRSAYSPWGLPEDLLYAVPKSAITQAALKSCLFPPIWTTLFSLWFKQPRIALVCPSNEVDLLIPLWNNDRSPLWSRLTAGSNTLSLAKLNITRLVDLLMPDLMLWSPFHLLPTITRTCRARNLPTPTPQSIRRLITQLSEHFPVLEEDSPTRFHLPLLPTTNYATNWLIHYYLQLLPLNTATSRASKIPYTT
ncbi:hypothetical protein DAPPUDRAFT_123181, partial [Daphnia pulex]